MIKFWISLVAKNDSVTIVVGHGRDLWKNRIMIAVDSSPKRVPLVDSVYLSTGFGATGKWDILVLTDTVCETAPASPVKIEDK